MAWPYKNRADLEAAEFRYEGLGHCMGPRCGEQIEWWRTKRGKAIPLNPETKEPHFATCVEAERFRKIHDLNSKERRKQRGAIS